MGIRVSRCAVRRLHAPPSRCAEFNPSSQKAARRRAWGLRRQPLFLFAKNGNKGVKCRTLLAVRRNRFRARGNLDGFINKMAVFRGRKTGHLQEIVRAVRGRNSQADGRFANPACTGWSPLCSAVRPPRHPLSLQASRSQAAAASCQPDETAERNTRLFGS